MKSIALLTALSTLAALAPAQIRIVPVNVLQDPSFEAPNHPNWVNTQSQGIYYAGGSFPYPGGFGNNGQYDGHTGTHCWDTWLGANDPTYYNVSRVRQDFTAVPVSQLSEVSVWVLSSGATLTLNLYYTDGTVGQTSATFNGGVYKKWNATAALAAGKSLKAIEFLSYGTYYPIPQFPGQYYLLLDDAAVIKIIHTLP